MAKRDDVSSPRMKKLASDILSGRKKATLKETLSLAAVVLDNAPNKRKPIKKK